ncbi:hypothetical protein Cni_G24427 [Canna indica]|uniref:non-specific serine/threonine protein kinase n=1 Tax=Canna indica TaxID=4628 RepID=A0AAQ3QNF4_9LILI|nr:hypothetical protein Cni_G24427 [Canna indica]
MGFWGKKVRSLRKKMRFLPSPVSPSLFFLFLSSLFLLGSLSVAGAADVPLGSTLRPSDTSAWPSPNGTFTLGFISDPQNPSLYLAAITYTGGIAVWSAGGVAVNSAASLQLQNDGNLRLVNGSGAVVWESGTAGQGVSTASLNEAGDFELRNSTGVVWNTFSHPTDTILQAQNFTVGQTLRSGDYSFAIQPSGNLTLRWNDSITYFNKGFNSTFTANRTLSAPVLTLQSNGIVSLSDTSLSTSVVIAYSSDYGESGDFIRFVKLDSDGNLRVYTTVRGSNTPTERWSAVADQCEVFGWCGNMGICTYNDSSPTCECPSENFVLVDTNNPRKGCKRTREIQDCPGNSTMLPLEHTLFLTYPPEISTEQFFIGITACRLNCLSGSSCVASTALADGSGFCYLKVSNFVSGYRSTALPSTSFVKVCAPAIPNSPSSPTEIHSDSSKIKGWVVAVLIFSTILLLILFEWGLWWCFCRNNAKYGPSSAQYALLEYASGAPDTNRKKFSVWAYEEFEKGSTRSIMDKKLSEQEVDMEQFERAVMVSFWCIQEQPSQRPSMGKVVQMLEGVLDIERPPAPKAADGVAGVVSASSTNVSVFAASPAPPVSSASQSIASSTSISKKNLEKPTSSLLSADLTSLIEPSINWFHGVVVSTPDFESGDLGSNPVQGCMCSFFECQRTTFLHSGLERRVAFLAFLLASPGVRREETREQEMSSGGANASDSKVETISRLAQWRIESFGPCSYRRSDPFKIGIWNWFAPLLWFSNAFSSSSCYLAKIGDLFVLYLEFRYLSVEKNRYLYIRLFPEPCRTSKEQPPVAKFVLRVSSPGPGRRPYISPVHEKLLRTCEDFVWPIDSAFHGRFTIDVEFMDLKISPLDGGEANSIWPNEGMLQSLSSKSTLRCLSRMLEEGIHSDVTIKTSDGVLKAHKAVLASSSPVFESMFLHDLKEKESSTIKIEDMSLYSCSALLGYIYGTLKQEEFWKHRLSLLGAANKYDIADLKDCCEESLMEDINSSNVLERLHEAWLYQLNGLKKGCLTYLFDFGKIYDVRDEMNNFFRHADRELLMEVFQEILAVWKPL